MLALLAEDDSVLQAFLEVLSDTHSRRLLNPEAELLLLLGVIFLSNLEIKYIKLTFYCGNKSMNINNRDVND